MDDGTSQAEFNEILLNTQFTPVRLHSGEIKILFNKEDHDKAYKTSVSEKMLSIFFIYLNSLTVRITQG